MNPRMNLLLEDNQGVIESDLLERKLNAAQNKYDYVFLVLTKQKEKYDFVKTYSNLDISVSLFTEELESSFVCDVLVLDLTGIFNAEMMPSWIQSVCQQTKGQIIAVIDNEVENAYRFYLLLNGIDDYLYFNTLSSDSLYETAFKYDCLKYRDYQQQNLVLKTHELKVIQRNLKLALEHQEFLLHYQPQVSFVSGEVIGVEALIRWQQPEQGLIPPDQFIPIAEASLLIIDIGKWVLFEACTQAAEWHKQGFPIYIAVNVAVPQFIHEDFVETVELALQSSGLKAEFLEIEVTEGVVMHNISSVIKQLQDIRSLGVSIALDDFGTGFSSLQYLQKLPCDKLKIDRSFIMNIGMKQDDSGDRVLVENIIHLGNSFNLQVVAEGIETLEQAEYLNSLGCQYAQGFYYAKPIPAEDVLICF